MTNLSTIVEIIRAYQPRTRNTILYYNLQQQKLLELTSRIGCFRARGISTIVEIIRAYQPRTRNTILYYNLQQQKLLELTSRIGCFRARGISTIVEIIRAYQPQLFQFNAILSTIVEIIRAYQPSSVGISKDSDLQQQKLLELTSHF